MKLMNLWTDFKIMLTKIPWWGWAIYGGLVALGFAFVFNTYSYNNVPFVLGFEHFTCLGIDSNILARLTIFIIGMNFAMSLQRLSSITSSRSFLIVRAVGVGYVVVIACYCLYKALACKL